MQLKSYYGYILFKTMEEYPVYGHINDICVIGHGSIGSRTVPLIKRHFKFDKMTIIDPSPVRLPEQDERVQYLKLSLNPGNFREILDKIFVNKVKFCVQVGVCVASVDLIVYCQQRGVLYIDTTKEQWEGHYIDEEKDIQYRSNYGMRQRLLQQVRSKNKTTTAVTCCGANPGMVNWLLKQALLNLAKDTSFPLEKVPQTRLQWGLLMKNLGVKGVHISERDTQISSIPRKEGEFYNTWSIQGLIDEAYHQPAELGWGTHQKWMPPHARQYKSGHKACIYIAKSGLNVRVKSWCPVSGPQYGYVVTHDESISIPDYYTVKNGDEVVYRPTCHYAYHPCQEAVISCLELVGTGVIPDKSKWRILDDDIVEGVDEVGVLLYGHAKNAYWYGSQLDYADAKKRAPFQSATSLQVCSALIAGMAWALQNPEAGLVECDEMDFKRCLQIQEPYIAPVQGHYTDWNPLQNESNNLIMDDFDRQDPWQFRNMLIDK